MSSATVPEPEVRDSGAAAAAAATVSDRRRTRYWIGLAAVLLLAGCAIIGAMLRTSTTFDEIVIIAGGARGYETGNWNVMPEHPPLTLFLYGLPAYLSGIAYPQETGEIGGAGVSMMRRYEYAQNLFWKAGNDPERVAFYGRLPAVLCALGLIAIASLFARSVAGDAAGLLAAVLVATLPDVLAHGGVAYNDVPMALALFGAVWAMDAAVRQPSVRRALLAGLLIGIAAGVKNSAVALGPIGLVLFAWEALRRRGDRAWWRSVGAAVPVTLLATYLTLVLVYRGDFALEEYRYSLLWVFGHTQQMPVPAFLLGESRPGGWWFYFPVAFLFKTSAGLHVLSAVALGSLVAALRQWRHMADTPLRPVIALPVVFAALLLSSSLNIGFRYALPALAPLCVLTAVGVSRAWRSGGRALRAGVAAATVWTAVHVGSYYPHFLAYLSEYGPAAEENHTVLADSSLDWGQGLLELRDFMRANGIPSVYLSYFGSALPAGYGIDYVPMASFFALPPLDSAVPEPRWIAISATNLTGTYFAGDPFARFHDVRPDHVVARTIYLYQIGD